MKIQIGWINKTQHVTDIYKLYSLTLPENFLAYGIVTTEEHKTGILVMHTRTKLWCKLNNNCITLLSQKQAKNELKKLLGSVPECENLYGIIAQ